MPRQYSTDSQDLLQKRVKLYFQTNDNAEVLQKEKN